MMFNMEQGVDVTDKNVKALVSEAHTITTIDDVIEVSYHKHNKDGWVIIVITKHGRHVVHLAEAV